MSSGSQTVVDAVVLKFDMHVYTFVLTFDEVKNLVSEYAIPLDLHPCVPPYGLTMNRLPADKIGIYDQYLELSGVRVPFSTFLLGVIKHFRVDISQLVPLGLNRVTMFEIYCRSLEIDPSVNLLSCYSGAMPWRHQDSSVADPALTGVRAEDIRRLCENVIDLRPVHPAMLYAVGLTTIWKHVGHHPVFKDSEGNVATSMSQFLKFPMAGGVRVGRGTALAANESDHQRVVEVENERVLAAKRKAQIAKDKAVGKKVAEGVSHRTKKRKTTPLSFALSDSEADESNRSGSGTHHSASPLNTNIPNEDRLATSLISEPVNQTEEGMDQPLDNVKDTTETVRSGPERTHASGSAGHGVSSTSGGSHRLAFLARHPGGDSAGSSLRRDAGALELFVPAWNLTTHSILNDAESCRDMMRYEALNEDYRELFESHRSGRAVHLGCVEKEAGLVEKLPAIEKENDDLLDRDRERERSVSSGWRRILPPKRPPWPRQKLLPTVVQRLLSNGEYKKSLTDVFNLAIAAGWSEGVKAACSENEAQAFLATAVEYDPACKETFMTEFDSLYDKSYPYMEKLAESFRLPLGDLQNMWPEGTGPTLSGNAEGASTTTDASNIADASDVVEAQTSCALGNGCHLAIGSWTHPERLAFQVMGVTWPVAFGLILNVLHSSGSWTHPERLALWVRGVTWPLALGLIRNRAKSWALLFLPLFAVYKSRSGIPISAGIMASLSYVRLKGVSPLLLLQGGTMSPKYVRDSHQPLNGSLTNWVPLSVTITRGSPKRHTMLSHTNFFTSFLVILANGFASIHFVK
ncbi:hypothetical protein Tco_1280882 [Tanacetum coccineum]